MCQICDSINPLLRVVELPLAIETLEESLKETIDRKEWFESDKFVLKTLYKPYDYDGGSMSNEDYRNRNIELLDEKIEELSRCLEKNRQENIINLN